MAKPKRITPRKKQPKPKHHQFRHTLRCATYHTLTWSPAANPAYQPPLAGRDDKVM